MYNANLSADDIRALDKIKDLPAALREQVDKLKRDIPVAIEVPRDFYEDMQRRAAALHSTPELLIVQFCRRWITKNSDTLTDMSKVGETGNKDIFYPVTPKADCSPDEDDRCAHVDCSHRKAVKEVPRRNVSHGTQDKFELDNLGKFLEDRKISFSEMSDYSGVSEKIIWSAVNRDAASRMWAKHRDDITAAANMIISGEIVTDWQLVTEGTLFRYVQQFQREHGLKQGECCASLHISGASYRNIKHRAPIRHDIAKRLRGRFNI